MVLEQLFRPTWIEKKEHAFFLGLIYSIIGLISARLVFPSSVGLMSVAFTSVLLIPSLGMLLKLEENLEIRERKLSIKLLFRDHKDIFKAYIFLFLGVFSAYSFATLLLPEVTISKFFETQLRSAGLEGFASSNKFFFDIVLNNILVFSVCFALSLVYGAGSILFLTWNASVWGTTFAFFVRQSHEQSVNLFSGFAKSIVPFLPHMTTEALAYLSAAIAGGVVSKAVLREKLFSKKFHHIIVDALMLLFIGFVLVLLAGFIEAKYYY